MSEEDLWRKTQAYFSLRSMAFYLPATDAIQAHLNALVIYS